MEGENRLTLGERLSKRTGRIFKRAERRPRLGLAPEFYARFGLDDPWLSPSQAEEEQEQGDGFVYLSAIPYYNLMRRLARARKRREAQFERFFERRAGNRTAAVKRQWPGETAIPSIARLARSFVDEMVLPPPTPAPVAPEAVVEAEPERPRFRARSRRKALATRVEPLPSTARVFRGGVEVGEDTPHVPLRAEPLAHVRREPEREPRVQADRTAPSRAAAPAVRRDDRASVEAEPAARRPVERDRPADRVGRRLEQALSLTGSSFRALEQADPVMAASTARRMSRSGRSTAVTELLDTPDNLSVEAAPAVRRVVRSVRRAGPLSREVVEILAPEVRPSGWAEGRTRVERKTGLRPILSRSPLMSAIVQAPLPVEPEVAEPVSGPTPTVWRPRTPRTTASLTARSVVPKSGGLMPAPVAYARLLSPAARPAVAHDPGMVPARTTSRVAPTMTRSAETPSAPRTSAVRPEIVQEEAAFSPPAALGPRRLVRSSAHALSRAEVAEPEAEVVTTGVTPRSRRVLRQVGPAFVSEVVSAAEQSEASGPTLPTERPSQRASSRLDVRREVKSMVPRPTLRGPEAIPVQFAAVEAETPETLAGAPVRPDPAGRAATSRTNARATTGATPVGLSATTVTASPTTASPTTASPTTASPSTGRTAGIARRIEPVQAGVSPTSAPSPRPARARSVVAEDTLDTTENAAAALPKPRPQRSSSAVHAAARIERRAGASRTADLLYPPPRTTESPRVPGSGEPEMRSPGEHNSAAERLIRGVAPAAERTRSMRSPEGGTLIRQPEVSGSPEAVGPTEREVVIPVRPARPAAERISTSKPAEPRSRAASYADLGWGAPDDGPEPTAPSTRPTATRPTATRPAALRPSRAVAQTSWSHLVQTLERAIAEVERSSIIPAPTARRRLQALETSFVSSSESVESPATGAAPAARRRAVRVLRGTVAAASRSAAPQLAGIAGQRAVAALQSVVQRLAAVSTSRPEGRSRPMAFARAFDATYVTPIGAEATSDAAPSGNTPVVNASGQWMSARSAAERGTPVGYTTATAPRPARRNVVRAPEASPLPISRRAGVRVPATTWLYARSVPGDTPEQVATAETGLPVERPARTGAVRTSRSRSTGLVLAANPTTPDVEAEEGGFGPATSAGVTPAARRRAGRNFGATLHGVASGEAASAAPGWAARSDTRTTGVHTVDSLFSALARATSTEEVVRVIVERAATSDAATIVQSGPMAEVIREIKREVVTQTLEAPEDVTRPIRADAISAEVRRPTYVEPVPSTARTFGGGGGRARSSAVRVNASGGDTRITRLVKKLQGLIHLAEAERRLEAARGQVRMAEDTPAARAEGSSPMGPGHQSRRDLERLDVQSLVSEVMSQVNDILGSQRERRMEDSDESVWW